jgi:hypothetical protein
MKSMTMKMDAAQAHRPAPDKRRASPRQQLEHYEAKDGDTFDFATR